MSTDVDKLYEGAMRLPQSERVDLAERLMESVDGELDPEWEAAWGEEISRRIAEMDSGAVQPVPWSEVQRLMQEARDGSRKS